MKNLGFHFTNGPKLRDGQELIEGKEYIYDGEIKICRSGYHLSRKLLDALNYSPGFTLSLVEFNEIVEEQEDKLVCRRRKVIETHDVREIILTWACDIAEDALNKFWNISDDLRPFEAIKSARECIKYPSVTTPYDAYAAALYASDAASLAAANAALYASDAAHTAANAIRVDALSVAAWADIHCACAHAAYHAVVAAARAHDGAYVAYYAAVAACDTDVYRNDFDDSYAVSENLLIERLQKVFKKSLVF